MLASLLTLWLLYVALMLSPGVNQLLVSQLAASGQARSARWAGLGVAAGAGLWASTAALGLGSALQALPALRLALQLGGGLYLLHLARGLWRSGLRTPGQPAAPLSRGRAFARGLLTNLGNVKAALFFASVFVAVLPADAGAAGLAAAVLLVTLTCAAWYLLLARGLSMPAVRAAYQRASRWLARGSALIMGGLGLSLLAAAFPLVQTGS
ncbi:LysE family transporter [Inhella proteolytica]|uniref:LysE family transporter n=1 Tax=Inhella proteolytica TaxID=2795029 RepID=A0A931JA43_9BURK|nr:LysE family transporter [Inhella proteolytica]MBH9579187.1 LysE family transporter [Inhella proteolytica]